MSATTATTSNKKKKTSNSTLCFAILSTTYDILAQVISIVDVATDVIVLVAYYNAGRMEFFWISAIIIFLALNAYTVAFMVMFGNETGVSKHIGLYVTTFLVSPLIPFIFFICDSRQVWLAEWIENHWCFEVCFNSENVPSDDISKLKQWMETKVSKHMGFMLEAAVEAFPQAILQMVAIVYFREANVISIISILLSMTSVASKSFVISVATALTLKQLFFNWVAAVTDFFGIFFAISWVFYSPAEDSPLTATFAIFQSIWVYKLMIFVGPLVAIVSIGLHGVWCWLLYDENVKARNANYHNHRNYSCPRRAIMSLGIFIVVTLLWSCGVIASTLSLEIANWVFPALVLFMLGSQRCNHSNKASSDFWYTLAHWVRSAKQSRIGKQVSFTKSQDRSMRMCSINHTIIRNKLQASITDNKLEAYLDLEIHSQYMNVGFSDIRSNADEPRKALFWKCFFHFYAQIFLDQYGSYQYWREPDRAVQYPHESVEYAAGAFCAGVITFLLGPWYFLSRFLNVLFPLFIIAYLYLHDGILLWSRHSFESIDMFQSVMISIHIVLTAVVFVLFCVNADEQYLMHHMMPSYTALLYRTKSNAEELLRDITDHYYSVIVVPVRKAMVLDMFGADIGPIILSFLPNEDHFEDAAQKVLMVSTV